MKNDYFISYYDSMPILTNGGEQIDIFNSAGWYVQVSSFEPWGPFPTQKEAIESLLIEWPRFEEGYWIENKKEDVN
jgi:hypothetical protein